MGNAIDYITMSKSTPLSIEDVSSGTTVKTTVVTDNTECPSLEGNMDLLTQEQFTSKLMHSCRYDKVVIPGTKGGPLNVSIQIDVKHIEAVDQLVSKW